LKKIQDAAHSPDTPGNEKAINEEDEEYIFKDDEEEPPETKDQHVTGDTYFLK